MTRLLSGNPENSQKPSHALKTVIHHSDHTHTKYKVNSDTCTDINTQCIPDKHTHSQAPYR